MFGFTEIRKSVNNWTHDIKGRYEKELPIIDKIILLITEILNTWKSNLLYREYNQQILLIKSQYFNFSGFDLFYKEYLILIEDGILKRLRARGYNEFNAKLGVINFLLKKFNHPILEIKDLEIFLNFLERYQLLLKQREEFKKDLIVENYSLIYHNCLIISAYQKRYSEFYEIIGRYEDVDKILGINGTELRNKSVKAIAFINSLEMLLTNLENEKSTIELSYQSKNVK